MGLGNLLMADDSLDIGVLEELQTRRLSAEGEPVDDGFAESRCCNCLPEMNSAICRVETAGVHCTRTDALKLSLWPKDLTCHHRSSRCCPWYQ